MKMFVNGILLSMGWCMGNSIYRALNNVLHDELYKNCNWYREDYDKRVSFDKREKKATTKPVMGFTSD